MIRGPNGVRRIRPEFLKRQDGTTFIENEKRVLNLVRSNGALSRAELARQTDLTMQSVVRLVDGLMSRGFLRPGEPVQRPGPGPPGLSISLVPDAAFTFGVSIMTDAVSIVLMDLEGRVRASHVVAIDMSDRPGTIRYVATRLQKLAEEASVDPTRVFGVGVANAGYFVTRAEMNTPASMSEWALRDLEQEMSAAFDLPVWVENNGSAAAVGESLYGAGKRIRDFAYIYIAVGIGGGVIVDGALMRGFRGNAGEFTGVLPAAIRGDRPTLSLLLEMVRERGTPIGSISELIDRFDPTWPGVEAWLERTRGPLMAILSAIGAVADPEAIVIGGRAPRALAALIVERADYYQEKLRDLERPLPLLLAAEADGDAAALGAAALPLKQHFFG